MMRIVAGVESLRDGFSAARTRVREHQQTLPQALGD
jgi:hypothetical protein